MKATFRGGPWDGAEVDLPVLPEWISFGTHVWRSGNAGRSTGETVVLADPCDFIYALQEEDGTHVYQLGVIDKTRSLNREIASE